MARFGNDGTPGGFTSTIINDIRFGKFTMGATGGDADSISAYIDVLINSGGTVNMKAAIYLASDDSLVGETDEVSFDIDAGDAWKTFPFTVQPELSASTDYYLAVWCPTAGDNGVRIRFSGTGGQGTWHDAETYGTWPDPIVPSLVDADGNMFIYCDYTEESAAATRLLALTGAGV